MLSIKIGRHLYDITENDKFRDDGCCVQLLSQSKQAPIYGQRPHPVLSKKAIKEINRFYKIDLDLEFRDYRTGRFTETFRLKCGQ